jgi:AcrR family transcriptional regulator
VPATKQTEASLNARQQRVRRQVLRAILDVVAQIGHGRLSVAAVIESAGVSRGGFYSQFEGIDDCFEQALESCAEGLFAKIEAAVGSADGDGAVEAALGAVFRFVVEDQRAARALFIESLAGGPQCLDIRDGLCAGTSALIESAAEESAGDGGKPGIAIDLLIAGIFRLLAMRLRRREAGLGNLPAELPEWLDSYAIPSGPPGWGR